MAEQPAEISTILSILLPFIVFPVVWIGVLFLIAYIGGWAKLARVYRFTGEFRGERWSFQSIKLNWAGYNNALTIGANWEGLYLVPMLLFRFGHPPLFIPWYDISVERKETLFGYAMTFHLQRAPSISLKTGQRLAERLASAAGSGWPGQID